MVATMIAMVGETINIITPIIMSTGNIVQVMGGFIILAGTPMAS